MRDYINSGVDHIDFAAKKTIYKKTDVLKCKN